MSYIQAILGGKQIGIADQVTIDPALGCKNRCIGCYAKKSSQKGANYDKVIQREYNYKILSKSIETIKKKGFAVARVGKHCDPGDSINNLNSILECCTNYDFRCVVVSKSLENDFLTSHNLLIGNHILHLSIGPKSEMIDEHIVIKNAEFYNHMLLYFCVRWTEDITQPMRKFVKDNINKFDYIITPMRYYSIDILNFYRANKNNFTFSSGYYKPNTVHDDWYEYCDNICGEINGKVRCCNCLIQNTENTEHTKKIIRNIKNIKTLNQ